MSVSRPKANTARTPASCPPRARSCQTPDRRSAKFVRARSTSVRDAFIQLALVPLPVSRKSPAPSHPISISPRRRQFFSLILHRPCERRCNLGSQIWVHRTAKSPNPPFWGSPKATTLHLEGVLSLMRKPCSHFLDVTQDPSIQTTLLSCSHAVPFEALATHSPMLQSLGWHGPKRFPF